MKLCIALAEVIYFLFILLTRGVVLVVSFDLVSDECDTLTSECISCVGRNYTFTCDFGNNGVITFNIVQGSSEIMAYTGGNVNIRTNMVGRAVGSVNGTIVSVLVYDRNITLDANTYTCSGTNLLGQPITAINRDYTNRYPEPVSSNLGANALADSVAITDGDTLSKSSATTIQCKISSTSSPVPQLVIAKNGVDVTCTETDDGSTRTCAHTVLANEFQSSSLDMACYARMCDVYGSPVNFTIASSGGECTEGPIAMVVIDAILFLGALTITIYIRIRMGSCSCRWSDGENLFTNKFLKILFIIYIVLAVIVVLLSIVAIALYYNCGFVVGVCIPLAVNIIIQVIIDIVIVIKLSKRRRERSISPTPEANHGKVDSCSSNNDTDKRNHAPEKIRKNKHPEGSPVLSGRSPHKRNSLIPSLDEKIKTTQIDKPRPLPAIGGEN